MDCTLFEWGEVTNMPASWAADIAAIVAVIGDVGAEIASLATTYPFNIPVYGAVILTVGGLAMRFWPRRA